MDKKVKQDAIDTILEKGVDFTITVANQNLLHRLGILRTERRFIIYPLKLGTLVKISRILAEIDPEQLKLLKDTKDGGFLQQGLTIIVDNKNRMLSVIAYGLTSKRKEPSQSLIKFLDDNLTPKELLKLLIIVISQMGVADFLASMVSVTGLDLLETQGKEPIQTSGKQSGD